MSISVQNISLQDSHLAQMDLIIDMMGGDLGVPVSVPSVLSLLDQHEDIQLVMVGDQELIHAEIVQMIDQGDWCSDSSKLSRLYVYHTDQQILMAEHPGFALRHKRDSSLHIMMQLHKIAQKSVAVSAGSTGAIRGVAQYILGKQNGIRRTAIAALLPVSFDEPQYKLLLDVGAGVVLDANDLVGFAKLGQSLYQKLFGACSMARVGLVNVGQEKIKGHKEVQKADLHLTHCMTHDYLGFVEPHEVFFSKADVLVTDGMSGNILIKSIEGVHRWLKSVKGQPAIPEQFMIPSGMLAGVNGSVFKVHGHANVDEYTRALEFSLKLSNVGF